MKTIVRENTWLPRGYMDFGWGNGYVLIPKGNPLHGKDYNKINVDVNGGLTFSEEVTDEVIKTWPELSKEDVGSWIVGFDTCHGWDRLADWPKEAVIAETERLKEQLIRKSKRKRTSKQTNNNHF